MEATINTILNERFIAKSGKRVSLVDNVYGVTTVLDEQAETRLLNVLLARKAAAEREEDPTFDDLTGRTIRRERVVSNSFNKKTTYEYRLARLKEQAWDEGHTVFESPGWHIESVRIVGIKNNPDNPTLPAHNQMVTVSALVTESRKGKL